MDEKTKKIRELNDFFRMHPESSDHLGRQVLTAGVYALPIMTQFFIMQRVCEFEDFNPDNDPHGEHDFGAFEHEGQRIFWKIDYYNKSLTGGSEDPSDYKQTTRVLTTMLASEY